MNHIPKTKRRERGFGRLPGDGIRELDQTSLTVSLLYALAYLAPLWTIPLGVWVISIQGGWWIYAAVAASSVAFVVQASRLRALENLVHDASHLNWMRHNRTLNDLFANLLVAAPVMQIIAPYRAMHTLHHALFGSDLDPCIARAIREGKITRGNPLHVRFLAAASLLPELSADFYRSQLGGNRRAVLVWLTWHTVVVVVPYALLVGVPHALLLWAAYWLMPFFIGLPIIRALAESEEHDYGRDGGELQVTFTNDAPLWRMLVHPAGDAWHAAHHVRMTVPAWKVHRLHEFLKREVPEYVATLD